MSARRCCRFGKPVSRVSLFTFVVVNTLELWRCVPRARPCSTSRLKAHRAGYPVPLGYRNGHRPADPMSAKAHRVAEGEARYSRDTLMRASQGHSPRQSELIKNSLRSGIGYVPSMRRYAVKRFRALAVGTARSCRTLSDTVGHCRTTAVQAVGLWT